MGTSVSQGSPNTTNWAAVVATYRSDTIPVERVVQELWRAAQSEPEADWRALLAAPIVSTCLEIAVGSDEPAQALSRASREIARVRQSSLATDIAKRAIAQSFQSGDRARAFSEALFAETSNYLVSRDLPSYVGSAGRNRTVAQAIGFKDLVRERVTEVVRASGSPGGLDADAWSQYVGVTVQRPAGRRT